jgi:hypothetical protein
MKQRTVDIARTAAMRDDPAAWRIEGSMVTDKLDTLAGQNYYLLVAARQQTVHSTTSQQGGEAINQLARVWWRVCFGLALGLGLCWVGLGLVGCFWCGGNR